tara:strand:+ start:370 stop:552 length:183 start_codon:yes stop_codon:yes gene_type:complete
MENILTQNEKELVLELQGSAILDKAGFNRWGGRKTGYRPSFPADMIVKYKNSQIDCKEVI